MTTISTRLQELVNALGETPAGFAKKIGYSRAEKVYNWLEGRFKPKDDALHAIQAVFPEVSIDWIKTGRGSMFKSDTEAHTHTVYEENEYLRARIAELEGKVSTLEGVLLRAMGKAKGVTNSPKLYEVEGEMGKALHRNSAVNCVPIHPN